MSSREQEQFLATWEQEADRTLRLFATLPANQYDFRPDPKGRSLGELAWHLAEMEGLTTNGVTNGALDFAAKIPGLERPRTVVELAPGYRRVHQDAVARVRALAPEAFDRTMPFPGGRTMRIGDVLWVTMLHHAIHHRGQLMLMTRLAGGTPPGIYGPNREEMAAMRGA